jgi:hypothetical protein
MAVGTRIIMATRAATSKYTSFFTKFGPPSNCSFLYGLHKPFFAILYPNSAYTKPIAYIGRLVKVFEGKMLPGGQRQQGRGLAEVAEEAGAPLVAQATTSGSLKAALDLD